MTRYTVTYAGRAFDALARLWLAAPDRAAVSMAGDQIDRELRTDAPEKGFNIERGFRQLIISPLVADFSVNQDDRTVTRWRIRHVGELANGR
jgi:hypothetical protein